MRFLILAAAATALLIGGAAASLAISGNSLAVAGGSTTSTLPSVAPARTTEDVSGPCDEAEHANDARCGRTTTTAPAAKANRREDRAGHRHRHGGRQGRDDSTSRSGPGSGQSGDDSAVRGVDDNGGHGSDDTSGHGGGGNSGRGGSEDGGGHGGGSGSGHGGGGRDHPEDD